MSDEQEVEITVEPKAKGKPGRKPKAVAAKIAESPELLEMLMERFKEMMQANADNTQQLAESLRKPTELEQKKLDEEKEQRIRRHQMSIKIAQQEEAMKARKEAACSHANKDGHLWRAQVNSDGRFIPRCQRCGKTTSPIVAAAGRTAVEMHLWAGVNVETLENMAKLSKEQPI